VPSSGSPLGVCEVTAPIGGFGEGRNAVFVASTANGTPVLRPGDVFERTQQPDFGHAVTNHSCT